MASITDILKSDPRGLKEQELRRQVQQLADAANKRVRRMQQSGLLSAAEAGRQKSGGGMFSTRGKNYNQLQAEFKRAKEYLQAKTSTIKGARQFQKEVLQETNKRLGSDMTQQQASSFWQTMKKVTEQIPQTTLQQAGLTSYDVQKRVYEMMEAGITDPVKISSSLADDSMEDMWDEMEDMEEWDELFEI